MGMRIPAVALSPYARRGHVDHGTYGFESILKMIEYKFGLAPLTRRDRYASNIARSFDWDRRDLDPPELPRPAQVASMPCPGEGNAAATGHPDHDLMRLHTSGYLEGLGFDYLPATSSTTFRLPDTFERAYFATA
jgi:phospholipase C